MKVLLLVALGLVALTAARPSDIIDIEEDHMEHEQEGVPGTAVEGEYSWVAPDGNEYVVKYVADRFGYRVVEDNVVPKVRSDLPEAEDDDEAEEDVPELRAAELEEEDEGDEAEAEEDDEE
ncbi:larval cuticle protein 16/17-like [Penaeus japonicus]|uniref:larval cuticle protein 16/17-like n=1 Tax=Penaeus japonicus TaxID=27405 RepID=UPI001C712EE1|nr:larval cuticle protein 16/17-like [Penaeus japonicus]